MQALDRTLTYRLHVLHKLTDIQTQKAFEETSGLSLSDSRVLSVIGAFGPLSVNDLASRANLHKGPASRAAQALVERKLVSKDAHQNDARGVILSLTPKGRKVFDQIIRIVDERNRQITKDLNAAEIAQLNSLIDRLIKTAELTAQNSLETSP
jgi:DNA-binding MarR family transcriptional regulator